MSFNTNLQLRTPLTPKQVITALAHDRELADLGLEDKGEEDGLFSHPVGVIVTPWEDEDCHMITGGFQTGSVTVTIIPRRRAAGSAAHEAQERVIASLLRLVPGDVCLANEGSARPALLRVDGIVYVNPNEARPESLAANGYVPERLVIGVPSRIAKSAAE